MKYKILKKIFPRFYAHAVKNGAHSVTKRFIAMIKEEATCDPSTHNYVIREITLHDIETFLCHQVERDAP